MVKDLLAMQKTWVQPLGWEDPLEKGMSTYSSILAWRLPWTEEPGELQSIRPKIVGHSEWLTLSTLSKMGIGGSPEGIEKRTEDKQTHVLEILSSSPAKPKLIWGSMVGPGEGNGNSLQYACLENSMDRETWKATQHMGSQRVRHEWMTNTILYNNSSKISSSLPVFLVINSLCLKANIMYIAPQMKKQTWQADFWSFQWA